MSENIAYSHTTQPGRARTGYVGEALPGVECKIGEHGEVLVKSPTTMMGYYRDEERTKEAMTEDGFLRTGDVGEIDELGRLKLTGRLKEVFKTSKGKYVAPAPIENKLMSNDNIEAVCVSGENQVSPFCLVMLGDAINEKKNSGDAKEMGIGCLTEERYGNFFDELARIGLYEADLDWSKAIDTRFVCKGVGMDLAD